MDDRELLQRLARGPATGDALAAAAGLTRAAVWKRIEGLRAAGIEVHGSPRGYALARPLDLLDAEGIRAGLEPGARALLAGLEVAWTVDSTNTRLLQGATPAVGARALLAERQTGGRGRRGRSWASPLAAHLYLSLARQFAGGLGRLGGLSLVAGIATAEALHLLGFDQVRLKWPNDLVVRDADVLRKLGGLLVEGGGEHAGPVRAVLGLGLNVHMPAMAAADIDQPWCDLATLGKAPARSALAATLLSRLLPALEAFDRDGLAAFLPRYAALDALSGRRVRLHLASGACDATALGLAEDGALRVRLDDGALRMVHSGEVSVRAGA